MTPPPALLSPGTAGRLGVVVLWGVKSERPLFPVGVGSLPKLSASSSMTCAVAGTPPPLPRGVSGPRATALSGGCPRAPLSSDRLLLVGVVAVLARPASTSANTGRYTREDFLCYMCVIFKSHLRMRWSCWLAACSLAVEWAPPGPTPTLWPCWMRSPSWRPRGCAGGGGVWRRPALVLQWKIGKRLKPFWELRDTSPHRWPCWKSCHVEDAWPGVVGRLQVELVGKHAFCY